MVRVARFILFKAGIAERFIRSVLFKVCSSKSLSAGTIRIERVEGVAFSSREQAV